MNIGELFKVRYDRQYMVLRTDNLTDVQKAELQAYIVKNKPARRIKERRVFMRLFRYTVTLPEVDL